MLLAALLGCLLATVPAVADAAPVPNPPAVIDGPSADIVGMSPNSLSVARDGTGGLVYLKNVGGVAHVFVSRLLDGAFAAPAQIDAQLPGASSQPVVAAGNGGLLLVAFINGGQLFIDDWASGVSPATPPQLLASGASNPAISISNFGKAYLAFTADGDGGHDIRCAYYYNGAWAIEGSALDANPGDDAGTGSGRPAVTAAGDGVGIVAWGEAGHVFTRRVWGTAPSIVFEQADVGSVGGWSEVSADEPAIASGGDSSYAAVAFHEVLTDGSNTQSRVLMQRLQAGIYDGLVQADGLSTPGAEGADQPDVAVGEYGEGFLTSARTATFQVVGTQLDSNESPVGISRIDSQQNASLPDPVPTAAGYHSTLIAWQQDPGPLGAPELQARFFNGSLLEPEETLSSSADGPVQAGAGLAAGADIAADVAVAWVQGTGSDAKIMAAQLYQPPGTFSPVATFAYSRTAQPLLQWTAARELWGSLNYTVVLDDGVVAQTSATSTLVPNAEYPVPLSEGPHTWQVTATNVAGLSQRSSYGTVFVDTIPPVVTATTTGKERVGSPIHLSLALSDAPPPLEPSQASGIASVTVDFGDGNRLLLTHPGKYHVYRRARRYRITVTVTDRAGNTTTVVQTIRIRPKPKPKHKKKHHHHAHH